MVEEIILEFPEFITHIPTNNPKDSRKTKYTKIGYNSIYSVPHYSLRMAMIATMHKYLDDNIPEDLTIKYPIETHLKVYVPLNYGDVKLLRNRETGKRYLSWKVPYQGYRAKWDISNLANMWLKTMDDILVKKKIIHDDTVEFLRKTTYEFIPVDHIDHRKLVYTIKTIK